jgi:multidrug efflux pump subunit AcrA (membrane-fusion protein)
VTAPAVASAPPAGAGTPSVLVRTEPPLRGTWPETITAYGTAAPAVDGGITLSVQSDGRVLQLFATPGEAVHAGQRLLDFEVSPAARSAYAQAQTALELARGRLPARGCCRNSWRPATRSPGPTRP